MSTHPNAILLLVLKPDDLARKTFREIMTEHGDDDEIKINGTSYTVHVMESDYCDDYQISADEGDIIIFDMVTYGYGERMEWEKLATQKADLEQWARGICERYHCSASFYITANYW